MPVRKSIPALSKRKLLDAWKSSRDSKTWAGRPGVDGITALQFSANLDTHLATLARHIRDGQYGPSRLKGVPIPKSNSAEKRLICIPTIKDRVVQRAAVEYLVGGSRPRLPIFNSSSYGSIRGRGVETAIAHAIAARSRYDWCAKTDIESFFDRIPRNQLKERIDNTLRSKSIVPIVQRFVDCEIKDEPRLRPLLRAKNIKPGVGVRQGMPLSPLLANLALMPFDGAVARRGFEMIRYVDDIVIFCKDKQSARGGLSFIKDELSSLGLTIPELADQSKTRIYAPREPVDFLGREIFYVEPRQQYYARVPRRQIANIRRVLEDEFNLDARIEQGSNFQDTVVELSRSVAAYLGIYKNAYNFMYLDAELRAATRAIMVGLYESIFGTSALLDVSERSRNFLGIGKLAMPDPTNDLEELDDYSESEGS
jgi:RNA-directed DNA polymerase